MADRAKKFRAKLNGDNRKRLYDTQKKRMSDLEREATEELVSIENKVKQICSGSESVIAIPYYIIYAKELYRLRRTHTALTLRKEALIIEDKWKARGYSPGILERIRKLWIWELPPLLYPTLPQQGNLIAYWHFDEAVWNGTPGEIIDSSGHGNNGQAIGATQMPGRILQGCHTEPTGNYAVFPHSASLCPTSITVAFWVKMNIPHNYAYFFSKGGLEGGPGYFLRYDAGENFLMGVFTAGHFQEVSTGIPLPLGEWHHVVMRYRETDGSFRLYMDGMPVSINLIIAGAMQCDTSNLELNTYNWFWGPMGWTNNMEQDEMAIWNIALSDAEILSLYNSYTGL